MLSFLVNGYHLFHRYSGACSIREFFEGSTLNELDVFEVAVTTPPGIVLPLLLKSPDAGLWFYIRQYRYINQFIPQVLFTCPAGSSVQDRFNAKVPIWRHQYQALFADLSTRLELRSYHPAEGRTRKSRLRPLLPAKGRTYDTEIPCVKSTACQVPLSEYMQKAWATFARDPAQELVNNG
ncbi:hypothetical protein CVT25_005104 [Psilocybe cyanescens]|uniref:Uncharacterized protein n=1 Tax=Psilocybe cyanescens TaxID=93625 RepID=A0A409XE38_PSICY|nr:hypothetical protein CVT25_005104 [Psilocybe cyanescens]